MLVLAQKLSPETGKREKIGQNNNMWRGYQDMLNKKWGWYISLVDIEITSNPLVETLHNADILYKNRNSYSLKSV